MPERRPGRGGGRPAEAPARLDARAFDASQQAAQYSGVQYNLFIGAAQARSIAASAPSITTPQPKVATGRLRGRSSFSEFPDRLHDENSSRVMVFYGLGGAGKSTVVLDIAHRAMSAGIEVFWIPADEPNGMRAAFYALAYTAGAKDDDFDHAHPADVLWRYLNALASPWLLVIDNADDPAAFGSSRRRLREGTEWIRPPAGPNGSIIVSSRNGRPERWASWIDMRYVRPLSSEAGAQLLMDLAPDAGGREEAEALSSALGGIPLALESAGSYLAAVSSDPFPVDTPADSYSTYRERLDDRIGRLTMTEHDGDDSTEIRRALSTTWEISLDLLADQGHDLARPILRLISCFASSPLPYRAVFDLGVLGRSPLFPHPTAERVGGALRALSGLSLLSLERAERNDGPWAAKAGMHQLVRTITRVNARSSGELEEHLSVAGGLLDRATSGLDAGAPSDWGKWSMVAPHCLAPLEVATRMAVGDSALTRKLVAPVRRAAWYRYMTGQYTQSVSDHQFALDVARRRLGPASVEAISLGNALGRAVREGGDVHGSEVLLRSVLETASEALGPRDPLVLNIRLNLCRTIREDGRHALAESELRDLLRDARDSLGEENEDTLVIGLNLAVCLRVQGLLQEALAEYRHVLRGWRAAHTEEDLNTLDIRFEIARTRSDLGDHREAEEELHRILEIAVRVYGAEHPNTLTIRNGLANTLIRAGRAREAVNELRRTLEGQRSQLGPGHPSTKATETMLREIEASI